MPVLASANVYVSEIAWMGSSASANDEWIEIFNSGSEAVSLSGWTLAAQDGSPEIPLSGTIDSGAFFVFERTDDGSASGVSAAGIYTGALSNSGEVLVLRDSSGVEIDRVNGSEGWADIGGDNESKETAQFDGVVWKTDMRSPGSGANTAAAPEPEEEEVVVEEDGKDDGSGQEDKRHGPLMTLDVPRTQTAFVGSDHIFKVSAYDWRGVSYEKAGFVWNFGDGTMGAGDTVAHTYHYPGAYEVQVSGTYGNRSATSTIQVSVIEPPVIVKKVGARGVLVQNDGEAKVDIGGWQLVQFGTPFVIPEGTQILAGATIAVPHAVTGFSRHGAVQLLFTNGAVVDASYVTPVPARDSSIESAEDAEEIAVATSALAAAPIAAAGDKGEGMMWVIGFAGLVLAAGGSMLWIRHYG